MMIVKGRSNNHFFVLITSELKVKINAAITPVDLFFNNLPRLNIEMIQIVLKT